MKVLHVIPSISYGGIEQVILRYTKITSLEHHIFTLSSNNSKQVLRFKEDFKSVNENISSNFIGKYYYLIKFLNKNKFDVIHLHLNEISGLVSLLIILIQRKAKIVIHSHNFYRKSQETIYISLNKFITRLISKNTKIKKLACTEEAGKWLFNTNFKIVRNSFALKDFVPDNEKYRNKVNFIARFEKQKQPLIALKIFKKYFEEKYIMQFIGKGSLEKDLRKSIESNSNIKISEPTENVIILLNDTDILLAPSAFEGLGIIVLEAYCSGCIVIVSGGFPKDILSLPGIILLDDSNNINEEDITRMKLMLLENRKQKAKNNQMYLKKIGYDLNGASFDELY